jgi:hypothetical protein
MHRRRTLCRNARAVFLSLCELTTSEAREAVKDERVFGRLRVLNAENTNVSGLVRMREEDMNRVPYRDNRLSSQETLMEIIRRTIHRYVNEKVQRLFIFPDATSTPHSVAEGDDDERIVRRFLHVSQRGFWPDQVLIQAALHVAEAQQAITTHLAR